MNPSDVVGPVMGSFGQTRALRHAGLADVPDGGSDGVRDVCQSAILNANASLYRFILKFINFGIYYSLSFLITYKDILLLY